jgi:hypothetical protein
MIWIINNEYKYVVNLFKYSTTLYYFYINIQHILIFKFNEFYSHFNEISNNSCNHIFSSL